MIVAKKFLFDVSFDPVEAKPEPPPPPPVEVEEKITLAELAAAKEAAFTEGRRAALAEAGSATASKAAAALETLGKHVGTLLAADAARAIEIERQAIAALRTIIAKVVPTLAAREKLAEIEALATKCLIEAIDEPRIVMRVANDVYDAVRERLDSLAAAAGYAGRIVLLADDALSGGDARIEWADGGAERKLADQLNAADAAMARLCDPPAANADPFSS